MQISNESGLRIPSKALCTAVHDADPTIHVHVDGAQGWGGVPSGTICKTWVVTTTQPVRTSGLLALKRQVSFI